MEVVGEGLTFIFMPVYVDWETVCIPNKNWKYNTVIHLFASNKESISDLHKIALSIGLKSSWFQGINRSMPHYDIIPSKKILALQFGAIECSKQQFMDAMDYWRNERFMNKIYATYKVT